MVEKLAIILVIFVICELISEFIRVFIVVKKTKSSYRNLIPFYYVYEGIKSKRNKH